MARSTGNFDLIVGSLRLPLKQYKTGDDTKGIAFKQVIKTDDNKYHLVGNSLIDKETNKEIDRADILKCYSLEAIKGNVINPENTKVAVFTTSEYNSLFKALEKSKQVIGTIISKSEINPTMLQKSALYLLPESSSDPTTLKWYAMLKQALGTTKVIHAIITLRNIQYSVIIEHYDKVLLLRYLHYIDEIREIPENIILPELTEPEQAQAKIFGQALLKPFEFSNHQNKSLDLGYDIIEQRLSNKVIDIETKKLSIEPSFNPFELTVTTTEFKKPKELTKETEVKVNENHN